MNKMEEIIAAFKLGEMLQKKAAGRKEEKIQSYVYLRIRNGTCSWSFCIFHL